MLNTSLLLLLQYVCEFADVALEELELFLGSLARGDNLHDGLEFWILSRALCQHVNDRVWCRRLRRRRWLLRLRLGLRRARRGRRLVLGWGVVVLIRALLGVVWPLSIGRRLLLYLSGGLARAVEADRKRVWFYDQLGLAHLGEVAHNLLLALDVLLVLLGAVGDLLRRREEGVEEPEAGARDPDCPRPLEGSTEHAAVLDILVFMWREIERLWLREGWQGLALYDLEGKGGL